MKVARTVLSGGKDGDNFKVLPIATNEKIIIKIPLQTSKKHYIFCNSSFGTASQPYASSFSM
ncbi:hypothetical protein CBR58_30120 [Bacillus thuringiensis]|nr:hypothetical protein BK763_18980 [Bacillus thuringiensis serovar thompsoni]PNK41768.1 hypothetical protein CBR58_30120 [Bacillus thuringiensis]